VAEHHDLQLLELLGAKAQRRELQKASEHDVTQRPEQRQLLQDDGREDHATSRSRAVRRGTELMPTPRRSLEDCKRFVLNLVGRVANAHREDKESASPPERAALEEIAASSDLPVP
jgi:hypothetical protein